MLALLCYTLLISGLVGLGDCFCRSVNWSSLSRGEPVTCSNGNDYVNRLYKSSQDVTGASCCTRPNPWTESTTQTMHVAWTTRSGSRSNWFHCPDGFFMQGLKRSETVQEARCSKPADHPYHHGHCYDPTPARCSYRAGACYCRHGYFVTGLRHTGCGSSACMNSQRCCKMADGPEALDELYKVKTRVMDTTMSDMALLAHFLGYGWSSGCRSRYVGEDFLRDGDTWHADTSGTCTGYMSTSRLNMAYGHWSFGLKDIQYGDPVIEELQPETIDYGTVYNNHSTEDQETITRTETSVRSVTHTATSGWKNSHELGIEISYTPPPTGGIGGSTSYQFGYESSTTTTDTTNNQQTKTFTTSTRKTLRPHSVAHWRLLLSKTRSTVPYTATVITKFSTELRGFLRWGRGVSNVDTNFHYQHTGSEERPTVNYRFGDENIPFYTALKRESDTSSRPWLWNDMKNAHPSAQNLINDLTDESRYEFTITGRFEDVMGKHAVFHWDEGEPSNRWRRSVGNETDSQERGAVKHIKQVAKPGPEDPPAPNPDPPKVHIEKSRFLRNEPTPLAAA